MYSIRLPYRNIDDAECAARTLNRKCNRWGEQNVIIRTKEKVQRRVSKYYGEYGAILVAVFKAGFDPFYWATGGKYIK